MNLLGATLTKYMATLAAIMTVTAGLPHVQCQCPNGQVKLFCQWNASSSSGSCCATRESAIAEAESCCCATKKENSLKLAVAKNRSCCTHSNVDSQHTASNDTSLHVVQATCCVKTFVTDTPVYTVNDSGNSVHQLVDTQVFWELVPAPISVTSDSVRVHSSPGSHTSTQDLVILLCHFTC
jgi:hypothetical protein